MLEYLEGIGYGDLYLPAGLPAVGEAGRRGAERSSSEQRGSEDRGSEDRAGGRAARPQEAGRPAPRTAGGPGDDAGPAVPPPSGLAAAAGLGGPGRGAGRPGRPEAAAPSSPPPATPRPAPETGTLDPHAGLFGAPPSGWERCASLEELAGVASGCTLCRLSQGRNSVVFGSGDPMADLMFIGEGPGAEEDRQGLPFVGPAGELLTKIIQAIGLTREQVYIANIVKCRPPGNRDPLPDEVASCRGYLERQIDLVRPRVIVALGRVAAQTLLESELPLGRLRNRWHSVRGVPVRATYHPAALLRNASWKRPTWEDMQVVRDRLRDA